MRLSDLRYIFALIFLPSLAAEELIAPASVAFRGTNLERDVMLRDSALAAPAPRGAFALPPGGQDLELHPTTFTPYDHYFGSVRAVIASLDPQRTTMAKACHLMKVGYSFEYATRDPYRPDPPKLTEAQRAGDCKSKALWLYDSLSDADALLVIGKADKNSRNSHAWVYWRNGGRWWILDCTDRIDPIATDSVSPGRYVPYYSFGKSGTFRHEMTQLKASQEKPGVAAEVDVRTAGRRNSR